LAPLGMKRAGLCSKKLRPYEAAWLI